ncbi:unnamed protein product [Macrosiphum euphorbiae]|uniref:DUF5641 domain-containing protein n=2 Tax=Macrosiphum euphorbiae TaxID=13131 RepID=A0AAV0VZR3_9HEMI|nr:unnamed protein product [Macrosiphum euphorbiae]
MADVIYNDAKSRIIRCVTKLKSFAQASIDFNNDRTNSEPSTSLPDPSLVNVPMSKYQRWRLITDLHRHFWTRWKNEYLSSLQIRKKWSAPGQELRIGDLVLVREATHHLRWGTGRIRVLHPGSDGISRVATLDTLSGPLKGPAVKLCPLPMS